MRGLRPPLLFFDFISRGNDMGRSSAQHGRIVCFGGPQTVSSAATSATLVDTAGQGGVASLHIFVNASSNTSSAVKWTSLVIQHGTTTDVTNFTAIAGLTGTTEATATTNQFILATHADSTNAGCHIFDLDLSVLERWIRVVKQADSITHDGTADVIYFPRPDVGASSAAERGPSSGSTTVYKFVSGDAAVAAGTASK